MRVMLRRCSLIALAAALGVGPVLAQDPRPVRLSIAVVLIDAAGVATPVPRHTLFVSDNPPSMAPRRVVTAADGTAGLNLRPGAYIVESDQPVAFGGQAYRWIQPVDVGAAGDTALRLTAANAIVEPMTTSADAAAVADDRPPADVTPSALLLRWRESVVALWTPMTHASGFVIDARGLIATSRRVVGSATSIEVQLTPTVKVTGRVLVADPERDVAIIRVAPAALESLAPVALDCASPAALFVDGQDVLTIGVPLRGAGDIALGRVRRITALTIMADFRLGRLSPGGPIFDADGGVVGLTSIRGGRDERTDADSPVVLKDDLCAAATLAERAMAEHDPPAGSHLPVEPLATTPADALEKAAASRAGSLKPYAMSSSDFDVTFLTPVIVHHGLQPTSGPAMDFSNWSDYVREVPPVLFVRVTPKQTESFWMKLARGAAMTQGASLPPITRYASGFARMRAFCGDVEVTPLHPFTLDLRTSETEAVREGLVVFAPDALGPHCGTVRLTLYSEKDPDKGDTREVDPKVIRQIWQDFDLYRARQVETVCESLY